jgi:beta-mannosidase
LALREPENWHQELVACNDTRQNLHISYSVHDVESGEMMTQGETAVAANTTANLAQIRFWNSEKRFYVLEWESEIGTGQSHYLAGHPAFDLEQYRGWLQKAGFGMQSG